MGVNGLRGSGKEEDVFAQSRITANGKQGKLRMAQALELLYFPVSQTVAQFGNLGVFLAPSERSLLRSKGKIGTCRVWGLSALFPTTTNTECSAASGTVALTLWQRADGGYPPSAPAPTFRPTAPSLGYKKGFHAKGSTGCPEADGCWVPHPYQLLQSLFPLSFCRGAPGAALGQLWSSSIQCTAVPVLSWAHTLLKERGVFP